MKRALLAALAAMLVIGATSPIAHANAPRIPVVYEAPAFDGSVVVRMSPAEAFAMRAAAPNGLARMRTASPFMRALSQEFTVRSTLPMVSDAVMFPEAQDVGLDRWFVIHVDPARGFASIAASMRALPGVELVEQNQLQLTYLVAPNDSLFAKNWGHGNTGTFASALTGTQTHTGPNVGTVGFDTNVQGGWAAPSGYGNVGTIIAIMDAGVDKTHPDIRQMTGYNSIDSTTNTADSTGHGTGCAGIAAGIANNTRGVAGAAGGCTIMPLKTSVGAGSSTVLAVALAMLYAANNGADILSMSFSSVRIQALADVLTSVDAAGVLCIASTGNFNLSTISFPANHPKVLAVGAASPCGGRKRSSSNPGQVNPGVATDSLGVSCDNETFWGSNWGVAVANDSAAVDLVAPTELPTTDPQGALGASATGYVDYFNGTSCSAPYVAGVAALILSQHPTYTPAQVRQRLIETAIDLSDAQTPVGWDKYTGYGLVNAGLPDMTPYAPGGWALPIVPRPVADGTAFSVPAPTTLNGDANCFISLAAANLGEATTGSDLLGLYVDAVEIGGGVGYNLPPGTVAYLNNIAVNVRGGRHVVGQVTDKNNDMDESNEANNRNAHQWSWVPVSMNTSVNAVVSRLTPPDRNAGRADVPIGETTYDNVDAVRMIGPPPFTSGEFWLWSLHPSDNATDLDLNVHSTTSSATDNFKPSNLVLSSQQSAGKTEWGLKNLGFEGTVQYEAASLLVAGTGASRFESRLSGPPNSFTGSTTTITGVPFTSDMMVAVHMLTVSMLGAGPISLELNSSAPLHMAIYDSPVTFANRAQASQVSTQLGLVQGLTRTLPMAIHAIVVYRDRSEGTAPLTYTITLRRPTAELVASSLGVQFAPSGVYKDGVGNVSTAPTVLDGNVANTRFYYGYQNAGPVAATGFTARELIDGADAFTWAPGALNAGAGITWVSDFRQIRGGRHTMGFINDLTNVIDEFNEIDNDHASQWVWSPLALTMEVPVSRTAPPDPQGGWAQVPVATTKYNNVDGLRTPVLTNIGGNGYWNFFALAPRTVGEDVDLATYQPTSTGPGNGFTTSAGTSALPAGRTDFVGIDIEGGSRAVDFGIVRASAATGNVVLHGTRSLFVGSDIGFYGPYTLGPDKLVACFEFQSSFTTRALRMFNISGNANLDVHVMQRLGDPFIPRLPGEALSAQANGNGADEMMTFTPTTQFPAIIVTKRGTADIGKTATFSFQLSSATVGADDGEVPAAVRLAPVVPNPVQAGASITFDLPRAGTVQLSAYDVTGRHVATLASGEWSAGRHTVAWDARASSGARLASGVYVLRLEADGVEAVRRMVVAR